MGQVPRLHTSISHFEASRQHLVGPTEGFGVLGRGGGATGGNQEPSPHIHTVSFL